MNLNIIKNAMMRKIAEDLVNTPPAPQTNSKSMYDGLGPSEVTQLYMATHKNNKHNVTSGPAPAYPAANATPAQREAWKQQMSIQVQQARNKSTMANWANNAIGMITNPKNIWNSITHTAQGVGNANAMR